MDCLSVHTDCSVLSVCRYIHVFHYVFLSGSRIICLLVECVCLFVTHYASLSVCVSMWGYCMFIHFCWSGALSSSDVIYLACWLSILLIIFISHAQLSLKICMTFWWVISWFLVFPFVWMDDAYMCITMNHSSWIYSSVIYVNSTYVPQWRINKPIALHENSPCVGACVQRNGWNESGKQSLCVLTKNRFQY